jgi:hypothetical protein
MIFLGGDPTGAVGSIQWSSWGGAEATGAGISLYVPPNVSTADGTDKPATVVAFDLGTCANHPAYRQVEWYFPGEGGVFDPNGGQFACAEGYVGGTDVQAYSPWSTTTTLFSDIKVVTTLSAGSCTAPSAFDTDSSYAWRCSIQGGGFYDPCFAPGPPQASNVTEVACANNPWSGVTLIKLSQPLASSSWGISTDGFRHPWALQLENGDQCGLIEGTGSAVDGVTLNFGCTYGRAAYPDESGAVYEPQRLGTSKPWTSMYSRSNSGAVTPLIVVTAWY